MPAIGGPSRSRAMRRWGLIGDGRDEQPPLPAATKKEPHAVARGSRRRLGGRDVGGWGAAQLSLAYARFLEAPSDSRHTLSGLL